jgi:hypothetical protein
MSEYHIMVDDLSLCKVRGPVRTLVPVACGHLDQKSARDAARQLRTWYKGTETKVRVRKGTCPSYIYRAKDDLV